MDAPRVSPSQLSDPGFLEVVIVNYNGNATLPSTLTGLIEAGIRPEQVIISDDGSTDGSPEDAQRAWPGVRIVRRARNCGIVNKVRNTGLRLVSARYVFLTDNDIVVGRGNLERLLEVLQAAPDRAIVTPRLVDVSHRDEVFYDGKQLHFLALSCDPARGRPTSHVPEKPLRPTFGGGIMMMDARVGRVIGWMDSKYREGWASDAEIQLRARAFGFEALHDSRVTMLHVGKNHGTKRALAQLHNRYRLLLTYYSVPTLLLLSPSLIVFELVVILATLRLGLFSLWARALRTTWHARKDLARRRAELMSLRIRGDAELLRCGPLELPGVLRDKPLYSGLIHIVRFPLELNWRLFQIVARLRGARDVDRRRTNFQGNTTTHV